MDPSMHVWIRIPKKKLNKAVIREYQKTPTLEEIIHWLADSTTYSILDVMKNFWKNPLVPWELPTPHIEHTSGQV